VSQFRGQQVGEAAARPRGPPAFGLLGCFLHDGQAFAYGLFTGIYGTAWVLGSIVIGVLITVSAGGLVAFCVASELAVSPLILIVRHRARSAR
jgi:hypothetical protein